MTQKKAAAVFGGGANAFSKHAFSKHERGDVLPSEPMDNLLRVADAFPQVAIQLKNKAQG